MAEEDEPIDKDKVAIALQYEGGKDVAPVITAKGQGWMAEQILILAREHGIEVREDSDLAVLLSKLDIGMPIPVEAYAAVAEILAYIYKANDRMKGSA